MTGVHEGNNEWNRIRICNEFVSRTDTAKHTDRETRSPRVSRIASSSGGRGGDVGSSAMAEKSLRLGIFHSTTAIVITDFKLLFYFYSLIDSK